MPPKFQLTNNAAKLISHILDGARLVYKDTKDKPWKLVFNKSTIATQDVHKATVTGLSNKGFLRVPDPLVDGAEVEITEKLISNVRIYRYSYPILADKMESQGLFKNA